LRSRKHRRYLRLREVLSKKFESILLGRSLTHIPPSVSPVTVLLRTDVMNWKVPRRQFMVTFVPTGVVVEGKATRPKPLSTVRIGKASLVVEPPKEEKEQEEK
jgi:hypothetical protein